MIKKEAARFEQPPNFKNFNLLNSGFNAVDYQLFRKAIHPNTPHLLRYPPLL